jgi:hypothetical protein
MRETLVTVQRAAEEKREVALREADLILKEAEVRASNWIEEAHRSIREIKKELAKLKGMRDSYVTRLRMLVQAQLDMLKLVEMEEETPEATLDLFEERLEELSAAARERVAAAGESDLPADSGIADEEVPPGLEPEPEVDLAETGAALDTAWQSWREEAGSDGDRKEADREPDANDEEEIDLDPVTDDDYEKDGEKDRDF